LISFCLYSCLITTIDADWMKIQKEIEVFLKEIYLNILDNKHSSVQQKQYLLGVLERICSDPRALVEIYLNYDCDRSALDNMFQR
jgi:brefeldin A-inhibited guanine nucleotide-exchange protein